MVEALVSIQERCYGFALRVLRLTAALPRSVAGSVIGRQVLRSGTSVGANCEEAKAAQSRADFVNKMNLALKEARETHYWLRLIGDAHMLPQRRLAELLNESDEIVRILTATVRKSKRVG